MKEKRDRVREIEEKRKSGKREKRMRKNERGREFNNLIILTKGVPKTRLSFLIF